MLNTNPFSTLAETVPPVAMQSFIIAMVVLIAAGTIIQMISHRNLTYFFNNAKKAKLNATKELGVEKKYLSSQRQLFTISVQPLSLGLVKEDWLMYLECMVRFYFGLHLLF